MSIDLAKQPNSSTSSGSPFEPLQEWEEFVAEYETVCSVCGQSYWRRYYISNKTNIMHCIRTACACCAGLTEDLRKQEQRRQQQAIEYLWGERNLLRLKGYEHMTFKKYRAETKTQKAAYEYMKNWTPEKGSVTLAGLPGRGKTHLAIAAAREMKREGYSVLALKTIDILARIKRCYQKGEPDGPILDSLKMVDVLVIDDIGVERPNDWVLQKLYEVIDTRFYRKTTIYTTNLTGNEISKRLSLAISSRVYGVEKVLLVEGNDWRLKSADIWADVGEEVFQI